jgi:ArsR family transcriptional regulator, lead/cadmium/zinc/bismuth-responsive transcriptional repressor
MAKKEKSDDKPTKRFRPKVKAKKRFGAARVEQKEIAVFDPDAVEKVLDALPDNDAVARATDRLQGLAHPSRVLGLIALQTAELCVGDVAAVLGLSLSATSTMLKQLRALGFVATRQAGKQVYYAATDKTPRAVLEAMLRP